MYAYVYVCVCNINLTKLQNVYVCNYLLLNKCSKTMSKVTNACEKKRYNTKM